MNLLSLLLVMDKQYGFAIPSIQSTSMSRASILFKNFELI